MKVLRIKAYQETACYTRPFANKVTETYPLPPYSTVKGMIHAIMNADELVPFKLSIQGEYDSMIVDYRKTYFVKKNTVNMPIIFDGLQVGQIPTFPDMTSMPLYSHMLFDINLIIHVAAEKEILQDIYQSFGIMDSHVSLVSHMYTVRIDAVEFVELIGLDLFRGGRLKYNMYIPMEKIYEDELNTGIPYQLNWTYEIKNGIREWNRIPALYLEKDKIINQDLINDEAFI